MHVCSCFKLCIGEQDEDSWGESGSDSAAAGKRSLARKSTAVPQAIHTRSFIQSVCL
ncbi:hypothetical protein ABEY63_23660 [Priestia aryabhattai]|uniref:hypothetical protein n=1 Tax=Priestia aryabhattai TaxID=412384 RepID=UPI003D294E60